MRTWQVAAFFGVLCVASPARAQDESPQRADAAFKEAQRLRDAGELARACEKFAESLRLDPTVGTLLNLADCHHEEGKNATALAEFRRAADLAAQKGRRDREEFARAQIADLEKKQSTLVLDLRGRSVDEVRVDDRVVPRDAWTRPIPLDAGAHRVTASVGGKRVLDAAVTLPRGPSVTRVELPAGAAEAPREPAPQPSPAANGLASGQPPHDRGATLARPDRTRRALAYVALGVGAVGLGVGTFFGLDAMGKKSDGAGHCDGNACDPVGYDLRQDGLTSATVATVGFGVGVLAAGAGVFLLVSSPRKQTGVQVQPTASGLLVRGTW